MSTGGYWTAGSDNNSAARLNQKSVTIDTGTNLAALSTTYPGQLIYATDNSSGSFVQDTLYQRNAANNAWVARVPQTIHDHSAATAATGGLLTNIIADNMGQFLYGTELMSPTAGDFNTANSSGGGSVANNIASNQWRVNIATSTTSNSVGQADYGGIKIDFGNPIKFQCKVEQETATSSLQGRIGTNIEAAGSAAGTTKLLGFEFCDSTGTTYQLVSCDGTTRTVTNTTQPFNTVHGLKYLYTPSTSIVGTVDNTTATTKTSNLPNSGAADQDKLMRFGITTTNTTAKNLYLYGAVIVGVPNDTWYV